MSNHPNRAWRARMRASLEQWIWSDESRQLAETPLTMPTNETQIAEFARRLSDAYVAGYVAGRRSYDER